MTAATRSAPVIDFNHDRDRTLRQRLVNDPSLIRGAVDEFLRVITPETTTARRVTRDVELGGVALEEGEFTLLALTAANHDEQLPARIPDYSLHMDRARRFPDLSAANGWLNIPASTNHH